MIRSASAACKPEHTFRVTTSPGLTKIHAAACFARAGLNKLSKVDQFSAARRHLELLLENERDGQRNEDTTRLHLIDPLLMDCLGWMPEDIVTEERLDGQYADYVVGRPMARLILEANVKA